MSSLTKPIAAAAFLTSPCALTKQFRIPRLARHQKLCSIRLSLDATSSASGVVSQAVDWVCQNNGKLSHLLDFSRIDARSRLGVAISHKKDKLLKGTELAELPEGSFLTPAWAKSLLENHCGTTVLESLNLADESFFALGLLVERLKRDESEYAALLNALPDVGDLDSPDFWSTKELNMLRGSPLYSKTMQIREAIEKEWQHLDNKLFMSNRAKFPEADFTLELYKWALGIVDSRAVSAGSSAPRILAPVLQNLNPPLGDTTASARVDLAGGMFLSKKRVVLLLDRDLEAGEEVSVSCGEGAYNSDYLLERGVVVEGRANKLEMSLELTRLDRFYEDKVDILEMVGMEESPTFELLEADENGKWEAPENMDAFLRLMCVSGADAFLLESVFRGEVWDFMGLPVSEENEKAMCEVMIGACEDALEEYSKRYEGEEDKDVDNVWRERREMAKIVVEGEKKIVKAALKKYKGTLNSLDALEYYAERRLKTLDLLRPVDESEIVDAESGGRIGRAFDEYY